MTDGEYDQLYARVMASADTQKISRLLLREVGERDLTALQSAKLSQHLCACMCRDAAWLLYDTHLTWDSDDLPVLQEMAEDLHEALQPGRLALREDAEPERLRLLRACVGPQNMPEQYGERLFESLSIAADVIGGMLAEILMVRHGYRCRLSAGEEGLITLERDGQELTPQRRVFQYIVCGGSFDLTRYYLSIVLGFPGVERMADHQISGSGGVERLS